LKLLQTASNTRGIKVDDTLETVAQLGNGSTK